MSANEEAQLGRTAQSSAQPDARLLAGDRLRNAGVDAVVFAAMTAVFSALAFTARYAPDFFVQVTYLDQLKGDDIDPVASLLRNTVVLDCIVFPLHAVTGLSTEAALKLFYVVVFATKYALLFRFCRPRAYVIAIFLWCFFSFDVNQARFNFSWVLLIVALRGRHKLLSSAAAIAAHVASALVLPFVVAGRAVSKKHLLLIAAIVAGCVAYASAGGLTYDERFLEYLETDGFWIPQALIASPAMLLALRRQFTPATRSALVAMALLPIGIATLHLAMVSARFMEIIFAAFLIKLGVDDVRPSARNLILVTTPGFLMFTVRVFSGITPGQ